MAIVHVAQGVSVHLFASVHTRCWCVGNGAYISASSIADGHGKLADKKIRAEYGGDIELVP
jgi:hypothetical protein